MREGPIQADRQQTGGETQTDAEVCADLFQRHLKGVKPEHFLSSVYQISQ